MLKVHWTWPCQSTAPCSSSLDPFGSLASSLVLRKSSLVSPIKNDLVIVYPPIPPTCVPKLKEYTRMTLSVILGSFSNIWDLPGFSKSYVLKSSFFKIKTFLMKNCKLDCYREK